MKRFGKAKMNDVIARILFKAGVDVLAKAILNDPRLLITIIAPALNESLAKQTETFTKIVQNNAERLKQETTKMSVIAKLLQNSQKTDQRNCIGNATIGSETPW